MSRGPCLYYGRRKDLRGVSVEQSGFFDSDLARATVPQALAGVTAGVPFLFGADGVMRSKDRSSIAADLFASAFFLASRLEEPLSSARDRHNRFPASASLAATQGFLERPLVDEYARFLSTELTRVYPTLTRRYPWPVVTRFAVCITHDVETLKSPSRLGYLKTRLLSAGRAAAKGDITRGVEQSAAGIIRALSGHNPTWSFDRLRDSVRPWPATLFFFGGATSNLDGAYDVESGRIKELLEALAADGCEIGAHLGYETGADAGLMKAQSSKVSSASGKAIKGVRHHYLRAEFPSVWKAHEKAGFLYDASLGYPEAAGFRAGTSLPFRPFDCRTGRISQVFALPLVVMDGMYFQYQRLPADETVANVLRLAETVQRAGGVFTLLWHNTMVDPVDKPGPSRAYTQIVAALKDMGAWGATAGEVVEVWRSYCQSLEEEHV